MEIRKSDLRHEDPKQDIVRDKRDLVVDLKGGKVTFIGGATPVFSSDKGDYVITFIKEPRNHGKRDLLDTE